MPKEETGTESGILTPVTEEDRQAVRAELERLLADPLFRNSKRYPPFLRHVVEQALAGRGAMLKERSIGVDIFERAPDYDNNADHIVRTTAAEIRKRMARFYQTTGHDAAIRIELPPGSYVPEFRLAASAQAAVSSAPAANETRAWLQFRVTPKFVIAAVAVLLLLLAFWALLRFREPGKDSALEHFWRPIVDAPGEAYVAVAPPGLDVQATVPDPLTLPTYADLHASEREHISVGDAEALAHVVSVLGAERKPFQWKRTPISLADLRQGSVILIGGFNNDWTVRLTGQLRFSLRSDAKGGWIGDRLHPENRDWTFNLRLPPTTSAEDYGLISRVSDPTTGRQVLTAGGIGKYGTVAAGEFISSPTAISELDRRAPKGWENRNLQIVIRTKVISDQSGAPELVAVAVF